MNVPAGVELRVINGTPAVWVHSGSRLDVAGCHHYQDNIAAAVGGKTADGHNDNVVAWLVPEPHNAYDRNAVRVDVNGQKVGYLPRAYAEMFQPGIVELGATYGRPVACAGQVTGGQNRPYKRGKGTIDREFEVRVDFTVPMRVAEAPMPRVSSPVALPAATPVASGPPRWFWGVVAASVAVFALFGGCALLVAVAPSAKHVATSATPSAVTAAPTASSSAVPAKTIAKPPGPAKR